MLKGFLQELDKFLLNNEKCNSDEREILIETAFKFKEENGLV